MNFQKIKYIDMLSLWWHSVLPMIGFMVVSMMIVSMYKANLIHEISSGTYIPKEDFQLNPYVEAIKAILWQIFGVALTGLGLLNSKFGMGRITINLLKGGQIISKINIEPKKSITNEKIKEGLVLQWGLFWRWLVLYIPLEIGVQFIDEKYYHPIAWLLLLIFSGIGATTWLLSKTYGNRAYHISAITTIT